MTSATCPNCQALFENLNFAPGTQFECGACHGLVTVPEAAAPLPKLQPIAPASPPPAPAPATPPPARKAPLAGPARKAPAGRRPAPAAQRAPLEAPPQRSAAARSAAPAAGKKNQMPLVLGGAGILVAVIGLVIAISSGGGDDPRTPNGGQNAAGTAGAGTPGGTEPVAESSYDFAKRKASVVGAPVDDVRRFADMAYKAWEDETDEKEKRSYLSHWQYACKKILETVPEDPTARERLGHVLFDLNEAKGWLELPFLTAGTKDELVFFLEDAQDPERKLLKGGKQRVWLDDPKSPLIEEWSRIRAMVAADQSAEKERQSDPFFRSAQSEGDRVARELSTDTLRMPGVTGTAFEVVVGKPYVILVQKDLTMGQEKQIGERISKACEDLERQFYERYGGSGLKEINKARPVIVLRDREQYVKYMRRRDSRAQVNSAAHFEPWSKRIVMYLNTDDKDREILFHEGTHALVDWAMEAGGAGPGAGTAQALWFSEGVAEFFGGHGLGEWDAVKATYNYRLGLINLDSVTTVADALERGDFMPLAEQLEYSRAKYQQDVGNPNRSRRVSIAYAQGWALSYMLQTWHKDKYGEAFKKYAAGEFKGRSGKSAFEAAFGAGNLSTIENELKAMVRELKKAQEEKRIVNGEVPGR